MQTDCTRVVAVIATAAMRFSAMCVWRGAECFHVCASGVSRESIPLHSLQEFKALHGKAGREELEGSKQKEK